MSYRGFAALAVFVASMMKASASHGNECFMLDTRVVKYAHASCEGQSASSCWTVSLVLDAGLQ